MPSYVYFIILKCFRCLKTYNVKNISFSIYFYICVLMNLLKAYLNASLFFRLVSYMKSQLGLYVLYLLCILNFSLIYNAYRLYFNNTRYLVQCNNFFHLLIKPKNSDKNCCQKILKQNSNKFKFDTLTEKQKVQISTELCSSRLTVL